MSNTSAPNKDLPGTILAFIFIGVGCLAWWDTFDMGDSDSYVFPRAVIVTLIVCCLLLIGRNIIWGGGKNHKPLDGSAWRRIGLVLAMLGTALLMPVFGFIIVGMVLFGVLIIIAMFEPWTRKLAIAYPLIGATIVISFYLLFAVLLNVTLPTGSLFD
ncbi:MAG: tripartite tricarboxylate transporter TctB family protein [Magnetovibrio sp.]|nr:tripartite tricarboxylate transporter TctB family protein [Magnetovibrio sp.]